jgi:uncharacterized protein (TIGR02996 family)
MTHDNPFLQAIIEDPDDDSLRLVYADYLEEHGQTDRAELIRIQCRLPQLPEGDPLRKELEARERALLEKNEGKWVGPLLPYLTRWEFRRGFLESVRVPAKAYLDHPPSFFRPPPIRHLEVDLSGVEVPAAVLDLFPEFVARPNAAFPVGLRGGKLVLAMRDPGDQEVISKLEFVLNREIEAVGAPAEQLFEVIERHYREASLGSVTTTCFTDEGFELLYPGTEEAEGSPVARLVSLITHEAIAQGASEIRIEPEAEGLRVCYRIGGRLVVRDSLPRRLLGPMVARVRGLASMGNARTGHIRGNDEGTPFSLGVSIRDTESGPGVILTREPMPS